MYRVFESYLLIGFLTTVILFTSKMVPFCVIGDFIHDTESVFWKSDFFLYECKGPVFMGCGVKWLCTENIFPAHSAHFTVQIESLLDVGYEI